MDVIVERCAGLDVHRDSVVATVRVPGKGKSRRRRAQQTRTFGTTIARLEQLGNWLEGFASLQSMESGLATPTCTEVWEPIYRLAEPGTVLRSVWLATPPELALRRNANEPRG